METKCNTEPPSEPKAESPAPRSESPRTESPKIESAFPKSEFNLFAHLIEHQKLYLSLLFVILLIIPLLSRLWLGQPLLMGEESYYHLNQAQNLSLHNFYYLPFNLILAFVPEELLLLFSFALGILSLLLAGILLDRLNLSTLTKFIFLLLVAISPSYLYSHLILSFTSWIIFLILLGFVLLTSNSKKSYFKYIVILPFLLVSFIDLLSSIFLIVLLLLYFYKCPLSKPLSPEFRKYMLVTIFLVSVASFLLLEVPFSPGPFYESNLIGNLVSDFGGRSGVPLFVLLLSFIGMGIFWKDKSSLKLYLILPLSILMYLYSQQYALLLSIVLIGFASMAFGEIIKREWALKDLKNFTLLILFLGLLFSSLTYISRAGEGSPFIDDVNVLLWVRENYPQEAIIFSYPQQGEYVRFFSGKEPFLEYHDIYTNPEKLNITTSILSSNYISTTFPLLEKNNISLIFIPSEIRQQYPDQRGLMFLLSNERFKLVHSSGEGEVWLYEQN